MPEGSRLPSVRACSSCFLFILALADWPFVSKNKNKTEIPTVHDSP